MKTLVIVESPTKARTIGRFLGNDFDVTSSMGHIRDLPKSKIGVDVENNFEPEYETPDHAKKTVADLKKRAKNASEIILATDEDREGEAIAWHLMETLKIDPEKTKRIVFHEITKNAIQNALEHPRKLYKNLIDAQQARRILDRLVGYELSPFLWEKVRRGLSAGRVQSVVVRLIVEREEEIRKFKPEEYWQIFAELEKRQDKFRARLHKIDDKPLKKFDIPKETSAKKILNDLEGAEYKVSDVQKKETRKNPAPPFITSTLQQECARKLGYSAKQTMMIAQQLYEGINLKDEGSTGLITYMRTDSVALANEALESIKQIIVKKYGAKYGLPEPRRYKVKAKGAQEAHEAIRPTDAARTPESIKNDLDAKQYKVYSLIWKRAVASQMQQAVFDQTSVDITATNRKQPAVNSFIFRASGQIIKFDGFIKVYQEGRDDNGTEDESSDRLPELSVEDILKLLKLEPKQSFTEPPPRYTDASIIKALEEFGIGRPSTYAPTIATIIARGYVEKKEKKFFPTEIAFIVNKILTEHFPQIVDIEFTAKMEENLDEIAEGNKEWQPVIKEFYDPFKKNLKEKKGAVEKYVEPTDKKCPLCGKPLVIKFGRMGKFLTCSDYPNCKHSQPTEEEKKKEDELAETTKGELCPICGKAMLVKKGRFGYFLGCSDYPACKGISKIWNKTGFKCPNCKTGDIAEKKSRGRGKSFYACTRYPDCNFIMNKKPESEEELHEALKHWQANPPKPRKEFKKKKYS